MATVREPWFGRERPAFTHAVAVGGAVIVASLLVALRATDTYPWNDRIFDLWAYWSSGAGLDYTTTHPGTSGAYLYSPAFAHLIAPLTALPLPWFTASWTVLLVAALAWLTGWRALLIGLLPPVALSLAIGQVDILMAVAIVVGFRWPAAWLVPVLTKVTPVVGLLWFAARREWRHLVVAIVATSLVAGVSILIDPAAWRGWLGMLARLDFPGPSDGVYLPVPIWVRLPVVAALVVWAGRHDQRWLLPVAMTLSLPTVWINTPTILVASLPLVAAGAGTPASRWLRRGPAPVAPTLPREPRIPREPGIPPGRRVPLRPPRGRRSAPLPR